MKLTASPFDAHTGALLPVYRDAYLRGDLSRHNTQLVDAYLRKHHRSADDTLRRFYEMKQQGERVQATGWVQRQFDLIRTEPQRFRRRAATLVGGAALLAGVTMAATNLPTPSENLAEATTELNSAGAAAVRLTTVRGRILNENGRPLVGATVLDKLSGSGVTTDAEGNYALTVPASRTTQLHYGYGGYQDEVLPVQASFTRQVTLVPRTDASAAVKKQRRWWLF